MTRLLEYAGYGCRAVVVAVAYVIATPFWILGWAAYRLGLVR